MSASTRPSLNKTAALLAIVVGVGAGSYGVASAASGSGSTATTTSAAPTASAPSAPPGATAQNPWGHQRSDETPLTGDALAKVKAIAEAKVARRHDRPRRDRRRRRRHLRGAHDEGRRLAGDGVRRQQLRVRERPVATRRELRVGVADGSRRPPHLFTANSQANPRASQAVHSEYGQRCAHEPVN